jgi:hypothetical protein
LTWRSGAEQWAFRLMHSAVTGTLQDLSEHASKDEIIAAIHAVRGSVPSSTPAERCTATAETSFDTVSTCTVAESSPGRWEPEMRQVDERNGISDNGPALGSLDPITPTVDVQSLDTPLPLTVEAPYEHRELPFLETCTTDELKSCAFVESSVVSENVLVDETASDTFGPHIPKFTEAEVDVIKRTVEASVRHQTESELRAEFEVMSCDFSFSSATCGSRGSDRNILHTRLAWRKNEPESQPFGAVILSLLFLKVWNLDPRWTKRIC